jgi:hypothetical protein
MVGQRFASDQRLTTNDRAHREKTMSFLTYFNSLKQPEHRLAWAVAIAADALQIAAFPLFAEGGVSPADSLLDLIVAFVLIRLLGWHWAFLPTLAAELVPGADLFPTWTAAVWFVTRQQMKANNNSSSNSSSISSSPSNDPEILPPGPAPAPRR